MTTILSIADKVPDAQASAEAVRVLEAHLERARAGEIVAIAVVTVNRDRSVDWEIPETGYLHEINSGLTLAQLEFAEGARRGS